MDKLDYREKIEALADGIYEDLEEDDSELDAAIETLNFSDWFAKRYTLSTYSDIIALAETDPSDTDWKAQLDWSNGPRYKEIENR